MIPGDGSRTWQVDRESFDTLCLENAAKAGATILTDTRVKSVVFEGNRAIGLSVQEADEPEHILSSKVVIDASGRASVIGHQLNLRTSVPGLRKATAWGYYKGGKRYEGRADMISREGCFFHDHAGVTVVLKECCCGSPCGASTDNGHIVGICHGVCSVGSVVASVFQGGRVELWENAVDLRQADWRDC